MNDKVGVKNFIGTRIANIKDIHSPENPVGSGASSQWQSLLTYHSCQKCNGRSPDLRGRLSSRLGRLLPPSHVTQEGEFAAEMFPSLVVQRGYFFKNPHQNTPTVGEKCSGAAPCWNGCDGGRQWCLIRLYSDGCCPRGSVKMYWSPYRVPPLGVASQPSHVE